VYVTDDMIEAMVRRFGRPQLREFRFEVTRRELGRIRSSQKDGRNHDVTLYIRKGEQVVVIAKPFYPPGMYRAPSGGLRSGESFEDGIRREMTEETGCVAKLKRFLLQTSVWFRHDDANLFWRSFVFLADYAGGDFDHTDHVEIREVKLADWSEFDVFGRMMRSLDIGGLQYRAALHEAVVEALGDESEV
jgi:ADP-ribose pyrophosphatase YjhB (NUDIX family)